MNERNHFHWNAKTYYFALIVCAAAIGVAGFLFQRNSAKAVSEPPMVKNAAAMEEAPAPTQAAVAVMAPQELKAPAQTVPEETVKQGLKTGLPVDGNAIAEFAMECLSYNATTRDWRTHDGVDLAAPEGTKVCAAADGTVQSVFDDDTMGTTVLVRHTDGYVSKYASVCDVCVAEGDYVRLGQPIACVGESAILENAVGAHVHFSVLCDGQPMDPNAFLELE